MERLRRAIWYLPWRRSMVWALRTFVMAVIVLLVTGLMFTGIMYVLTVYTFNQ